MYFMLFSVSPMPGPVCAALDQFNFFATHILLRSEWPWPWPSLLYLQCPFICYFSMVISSVALANPLFEMKPAQQ